MQLIEQFRADFEEHLRAYRSQLPEEPANLYGAIHHVLDAPAKRLRPVSVLLGYYLYKDDYITALPLALSIEIFHNFTLVHDDMMDSAALRRGRPTVHEKYDTNTAIMVGDVMLIHAFRMLLALDEHIHLDLIMDYYTDIGARICEGQIHDMAFEKRDEISRDEYMNMVGLKTSVLLGLSFQTGAIAAGKDENDSEYLFEFGYALGPGLPDNGRLVGCLWRRGGNRKETGKRYPTAQKNVALDYGNG
jgi:geranylgeranyl diphosphate synthase, type II